MCNKSFWNKITNQITRIRASRGYGIHSPFAFSLITGIIREKYPYYAYGELNVVRKELLKKGNILSSPSAYLFNSRKIDELIFRLVNFKQPEEIIEIGTHSGLTTLYMAFANKKSSSLTFDAISPYNDFAEYILQKSPSSVKFIKGDIYLNLKRQIADKPTLDFIVFGFGNFNKKNWELCIEKMTDNSLYIVVGINQSKRNEKLWKEIIDDPQSILTFDLGEVGLVFFDQSKIKQHYILSL